MHSPARQKPPQAEALSLQLRRLREDRALPQWEPAAAAKMETAALSKVELGHRLPTQMQLAALAKFYGVKIAPLESRRIAEEFLRKYGGNPALPDATDILQEEACEYRVRKMSTAVSKRTKSVDKPKKTK